MEMSLSACPPHYTKKWHFVGWFLISVSIKWQFWYLRWTSLWDEGVCPRPCLMLCSGGNALCNASDTTRSLVWFASVATGSVLLGKHLRHCQTPAARLTPAWTPALVSTLSYGWNPSQERCVLSSLTVFYFFHTKCGFLLHISIFQIKRFL